MDEILYKQFSIDNPERYWKLNTDYQKAKEDFRHIMMKTIIKNDVALGRADRFTTDLYEYLEKQKIELKKQTAKKHNNGYLWITINPKPEVTLGEFINFVNKITTKTCFTECKWAYEQRGITEADMGKGFHVHILAKRNLNYKPIKCKQNIKQSCKKIVGNIHNENQLNIQVIGDDFAKDKIVYITEVKTGEGKDKKQAMDIPWRKKNNLDVYYKCPEDKEGK